MTNSRCQCGKIVCEIEDDKVVIKCRHCKRYIIIHTKGLQKIEYQTENELINLTTQVTAEKES